MAKKYYVVRNGRKPGIYDNWESAKRQLWKFKNADHKSFNDLEAARAFLGQKNAEVIKDTRYKVKTYNIKDDTKDDTIEPIHYQLPERDKPTTVNRLEAVLGSSSDTKTGYYTFGSVLIENGQMIQQMVHGGNEKKYKKNCKITGEILGAIQSIQYAIDKGYKKVCVYHTLEGIDKWATGIWNANLPISILYKRKIKYFHQKITLDFRPIDRYPEVIKAHKEATRTSQQALRYMLDKSK